MLIQDTGDVLALIITQPLDKGGHQRLHAVIGAGIAQNIEVLDLQGIHPRRVCAAVDGAIGAAGQAGGRGGGQRSRSAESHIIIGLQAGRAAGLRNRLAIHLGTVQIGHHIHIGGVVGIGQHSRLQGIATSTAVASGHAQATDRHSSLCAAGVHAVDQQGLGTFQSLTNQQELRGGGIISQILQGQLVEITGGQRIDLILRPPGEFQGQSGDAACAHGNGIAGGAELIVRAAQGLVLHRKGAATNRHLLHLSFQKFIDETPGLVFCV